MPESESRKTISKKIGGGPHGLGDPDDKSLRRVEIDVMIPKKMRDLARSEKCFKEVEAFTECCKSNHILMSIKCRNENSMLKQCLTKWYNDEEFQERCRNLYLEERSEFRRTGIPAKDREKRSTRVGSNM
ncbi:hypothetical protein ABEB36_010034 [Hypothenemus hampei]|uniref:COX assembly mitochondrial protein n=1 Tax=Hypothenemus hampei TaxID=57062 RepID=A0ABD1EIB3_HYPHA